MNFSNFEGIFKMLELISRDEKARRFAYAVVAIGWLYAISALIDALARAFAQ